MPVERQEERESATKHIYIIMPQNIAEIEMRNFENV